jgi:hypothetical protein
VVAEYYYAVNKEVDCRKETCNDEAHYYVSNRKVKHNPANVEQSPIGKSNARSENCKLHKARLPICLNAERNEDMVNEREDNRNRIANAIGKCGMEIVIIMQKRMQPYKDNPAGGTSNKKDYVTPYGAKKGLACEAALKCKGSPNHCRQK